MLGLILLAFFLSPLTFNADPAGNYSFQQRAVIQRRRTVLVRNPEVAKQFPNRKTATVTYPVITGLRPRVVRKISSLISFKNIFDYSLAEYRSDAWLSEFSFVVNHNNDFLLDITFTQSGMAAYPDEQSKHFLINLKNGELIKAADAFHAEKLQLLREAVDKKLQQEISELRKENEVSPERDEQDRANMNDAYDLLKFELKDLDNFSVSKSGVTFLYDAGFPHVIKALEPKGRYYFSYEQLKAFINSDGPLGQFIR